MVRRRTRAIPPSPGLSAGARVYELGARIGSVANRVLTPNPARLGAPLAPAAQALLDVRDADPVILVGGYASMVQSLEPLHASLVGDGFRRVYVFDVPGNGLADIRYSAQRLAEFVARVRRETGAAHVDLVCHSAGGIVAREYVTDQGGAGFVDSLVTIATPHHGVVFLGHEFVNDVARLAPIRWLLGPATQQLLEGSELLTHLNSVPAQALGGVRLTSIYVDGYDGLLAPTDTAVLEGARNVLLRHPGRSVRQARLGHFVLHRSNDDVYAAVLDALV